MNEAPQERTLGENLIALTVAMLFCLITAGMCGYLPVLESWTLGQRFIGILAARYILRA